MILRKISECKVYDNFKQILWCGFSQAIGIRVRGRVIGLSNEAYSNHMCQFWAKVDTALRYLVVSSLSLRWQGVE